MQAGPSLQAIRLPARAPAQAAALGEHKPGKDCCHTVRGARQRLHDVQPASRTRSPPVHGKVPWCGEAMPDPLFTSASEFGRNLRCNNPCLAWNRHSPDGLGCNPTILLLALTFGQSERVSGGGSWAREVARPQPAGESGPLWCRRSISAHGSPFGSGRPHGSLLSGRHHGWPSRAVDLAPHRPAAGIAVLAT